jgi:hypothetical protein
MIRPPDRKKWLGLGVITGLLVASVIFIPLIVTTANNNSNNNQIATTTSKPPRPAKLPFDNSLIADDESTRINCFLEEESSFETLTEYQCVSVRGCLYKPSKFERVPTCYFDTDRLGYKAVANDPIDDQKSKVWKMSRANKNSPKAPYHGEIDNVKVTGSYMGQNIVNLKFEDADDLDRYQVPYKLNTPALIDENEALSVIKLSSLI